MEDRVEIHTVTEEVTEDTVDKEDTVIILTVTEEETEDKVVTEIILTVEVTLMEIVIEEEET